MNNYVGKKLGNYRICRVLEQGSLAEVYLGEHLSLKTLAAIKVLHARLSDTARDHFLTEARTIAQLEHPNIVPILEFEVESDTPYIAMSYIRDGAIKTRYPDGTQISLPAVINYTTQLASALQYAHINNLLHGDIKPANILLGYNGKVLLSDFGLTIMSNMFYKHKQHPDGAALYMAPEQLQGKPGRASDQYALGIIVYEWLCGQCPFHGNNREVAQQHLFTPPPPLRKWLPTLPITLEQVVMRALAKDPQQRFPSVLAFAQTLEQIYYVNEMILHPGITVPRNNSEKITHSPISKTTSVLALSEVHDGVVDVGLRCRSSGDSVHILALQTSHTPIAIAEEIPIINEGIREQLALEINRDGSAEQRVHQIIPKKCNIVPFLYENVPVRQTMAKLPAVTQPDIVYTPLSASRHTMETPAVSMATLKGLLDNDETSISRRTMLASMLGVAALGGSIFWYLTVTHTARVTNVAKQSTKTPSHTSSVTTSKTNNTTSVPTTAPSPQPTPTTASQPTPLPAPLQIEIVSVPALVINHNSYSVTVSTGKSGVTVALSINYTVVGNAQTLGPLLTDSNGEATFNWYVNVGRVFSRRIVATLVATTTDQQRHASSTALSIPVLIRRG